jgi:C1A family cysteine protease
MRSLVLFGTPPEQHHPYQEDQFDSDPSAFCYAFAQNYQAISYFRLDDPSIQPDELLTQIKTVLAAGFPCMFGFSVYDALYSKVDAEGHIPYPTQNSQREGGHAAIAVGYSDYKRIQNTENPGAFLIKNSWGEQWGNCGYGWLPYDYVLNGLAQDWWSVIKAEWVEKASFGLDINDLDWSDSGDRARDNDPPQQPPKNTQKNP